MKIKKSISRHRKTKLLKTKEKEETLKASTEKGNFAYRGTKIQVSMVLSSETLEAGRQRVQDWLNWALSRCGEP